MRQSDSQIVSSETLSPQDSVIFCSVHGHCIDRFADWRTTSSTLGHRGSCAEGGHQDGSEVTISMKKTPTSDN